MDAVPFNLCGVLVHARPERLSEVTDALRRLPGVEVHQSLPGGRLVVTVEDSGGASAADSLLQLHRIDGVVAAGLVYHHTDAGPAPASAEEGDAQ